MPKCCLPTSLNDTLELGKGKSTCLLQSINNFCIPAIDTLIASEKVAEMTHKETVFLSIQYIQPTPLKAATFWKDGGLSSDLQRLVCSLIDGVFPGIDYSSNILKSLLT